MRALVLSGGGLFGAWQAGAWRIASQHFQPDLIVGASIGSVIGYLISAGVSPDELHDLWRDPEFTNFKRLHATLQHLTAQYALRRPFALTATDILRRKAVIFRDGEITWQHLAASCAVPVFLPQMKVDGRWYSDGGLFNPLPVSAAVELGATEVLGLHVLAEFPSQLLKPAVKAFRFVFADDTPPPSSVPVRILSPSQRLGGLRDTLHYSPDNIARWIKLGERDAAEALTGSANRH